MLRLGISNRCWRQLERMRRLTKRFRSTAWRKQGSLHMAGSGPMATFEKKERPSGRKMRPTGRKGHCTWQGAAPWPLSKTRNGHSKVRPHGHCRKQGAEAQTCKASTSPPWHRAGTWQPRRSRCRAEMPPRSAAQWRARGPTGASPWLAGEHAQPRKKRSSDRCEGFVPKHATVKCKCQAVEQGAAERPQSKFARSGPLTAVEKSM